MTISIPPGRTISLQAKTGGGFESVGLTPDPSGPIDSGTAALGISAPNGYVDGETATITTDGTNPFGTKAQAAPIVWDMGADVRVDGVSRSEHASASDGDDVATIGLFAGSSANISTTRPQRHARIDRLYNRQESTSAKVKYGDVLPTGIASRKNFCSYWLKLPCDPRRLRTITYSSITGTFDEGSPGDLGEALTVTVNGFDFFGNIVSVNSVEGTISFHSPVEFISSSDTVSISGDVSGASATLNTAATFRGDPPAKLQRVNELANDGVLGVLQIGIEQYWLESNSAGTDSVVMNRFTNAPSYRTVTGRSNPDWIKVEIYHDWSVSTSLSTEARFIGPDGQATGEITGIDGSVNYENIFPTVMTLGMESSVNHNTYVDFCEVVVDSTPQRVVVGDAATYSACTAVEDQYISAWANGEISIELNQGGFSSLLGKYLFVFDADNNVIGSGVQM